MLKISSPQFHSISKTIANLGELSALIGASLVGEQKKAIKISGLCSLSNPKTGGLSFVTSAKNVDFEALGCCLAVVTTEAIAPHLPKHVVPLIVKNPHNSFAAIARALYPDSLGNARLREGAYRFIKGAHISETANLEANVAIEPGVVIGAHVSIGSGTYIGPNATIGAHCQIGRNCSVGASVSVQYSLIGDGVTLHVGSRIGQDGFGFVPGAGGLEKMPQLGRVIIQNNVEIGANTTVDRGTIDDTVIGEGTKIDNLVQVGHNVIIGRNCAIAGFAGLSGSCVIGDGCLIGGRVGIADHIIIGDGVQLAATASVMNDIPSGERWAGTPAQPIRAFFREQATLRRLAKPNKTNDK